MKAQIDPRNEQKSAVFVALMLFSILLLLIQMWLFVATLDTFLEGKYVLAAPAAFISLVCFGINVWMLVGLGRTERME